MLLEQRAQRSFIPAFGGVDQLLIGGNQTGRKKRQRYRTNVNAVRVHKVTIASL
jgi:hypothetical protein